MKEYDVSGAGNEPHGLVVDGAVWVALESGSVARVTP